MRGLRWSIYEIDGFYQYGYEEEDYYEKNENHYYYNLISEIYNSWKYLKQKFNLIVLNIVFIYSPKKRA